MCGIAGIISLSNSKINNGKSRVNNMLKAMSYRGPNGSGVWNDKKENVFIGNNRLAIVDPKFKLNGPLICQNKENIIAFNGEIYDYKFQRNLLINKNIKFKTNLDTEVMIEGLKRTGTKFLNNIDGVWALALYNIEQKKLTLCRDLMGEKHIFYYNTGSEFIFASEAKAILAAIKIRPSIDYNNALSAIRFFATPPEHTILKGIKRMKPGYSISIHLKQKYRIDYNRYAKLEPLKWHEFFSSMPSDDKVIDKISELLDISVRNRLPSDVPYISTLSGGIDSTIISYFASKNSKNINTLFGQTQKILIEKAGELNEYKASAFTSAKLNTIHNRIFVNNENTVKMLIEAAKCSVDGLLDWGSVAFQMLAAEVASRNYKVMIISDGPDELCGGYPSDIDSFYAYQLSNKKPFISDALNKLNKYKYIRKAFRRSNNINNFLHEPYESNDPWVNKVHHEGIGYDFMDKYFKKELINFTNGGYGTFDDVYKDDAKYLDVSQKRALAYANKSIPDFSNLRMDRGIMAESVEPRAPFLNINLVNFLLAMPEHYKYRNGYTKYILRKMVDRYIGPEIAWRGKQGFSFPLWKLPNIKNNLNIDKKLIESNILEELPWNKNGRNYFKKNNKKVIWPIYSLSMAKTAH